jgi:predicted amidophosphoribosyltransferase
MGDLARPAFTEFVRSAVPDNAVFVTWVPSHRSAKRERGYNQAEILARRLATGSSPLPCGELVLKTTGTRHQKGLGRAERLSNLRGAFSPHPRLPVKLGLSNCGGEGARYSAIVVVDDVFTTGATAAAVSSTLVAETGLPIHVFTFSRAVAAVGQGND